MFKLCHKCKVEKQTSEFSKRKDRNDGINYVCKLCVKALSRKWYYANLDRYADREYKRLYGISLKDYEEMSLKQNHQCAVCAKHKDDLNRRLDVDHDHRTGRVRGLLCPTCNKALGLFKEDPVIIQKAVSYIEVNSNLQR